jgi:alcohol dehydrogenase class IV
MMLDWTSSSMRFDFATATKISFGPGALQELRPLLGGFGSHGLVVTGRNPDRAAPLLSLLTEAALPYTLYPTDGEPSVEDARRGVETARAAGCNFVIAFGGGSALDTGKAIAALLTNAGDPLDYLEVIGRGKPITQPSAPLITIPTTAGTGSEVTSNAVLASPEHRVKVSLRSPLMLARLALVDPELTHTSPPDVTAASGLDALTQVLEPYVSNKANPFTDSICREGMMRAARSLKTAYDEPTNAAAREDMALVSLFGGIALSNAKLGAVHGFAGPFGGMYDAPHGAICARLLPYVMEANIRALRERAPESQALQRYDEIARILTGQPGAKAVDGVRWAHDLCQAMQVPPLSRYGYTASDADTLCEKAAVASSMQGNPIKLTSEELHQIVAAAL